MLRWLHRIFLRRKSQLKMAARALMALAQVIFAGGVLQEFVTGSHKAPVWLLAAGWLGLSGAALWVEGVAEEVED